VREGGSRQSRACVGAVSGGAACGRARFDAVDEKEMVQPLNSVQVELCKDACGIASCFRDKFVRRVCEESEKGGEIGYCGCLRCTCAAHDYGKNTDLGTWRVLSNGIGEGGLFIANQLCGVGEVVLCAILPFPCLNLFN
jgi:hypothetical protein